MSKQIILVAIGLSGVAMAQAAAAQAERSKPAAQVEAIERCRGIASAEQRLACYDAAAEALAQAWRSGDVVVVDRESIRTTRRSLFGLGLPSLPFLGGGDGGQEARELQATIREARGTDHAKWLIVLDDGAVWQTVEPDTRSRDPRAGETVTIRKAALGNYFISWKGSRSLSARRVR